MKRYKRRIPSGLAVVRSRREKTSHAKCASCGKILHGIPRGTSSEIRKFPKSELKVSRKFGGYYCSACTREILRERARRI